MDVRLTEHRIALLIDHIESDYHVEMVSGVLRAARSSAVQVVIVAGGGLGTDTHPVGRNFVYDQLLDANIAGLLVLAGSLSNFCGREALESWLGRFGTIPVVCIGLDVDGRPSIYVDNQAGVYDSVTHLAVVHKRRRIACIRGPDANHESTQRFFAYQRAITDAGLSLDPKLVWQSEDPSRDEGARGVSKLWTNNAGGAEIDALVCVNDDTALGALEEFTRRRVKVPEQVALVGFDDAANASSANPPLTTVNQQVELQGFTASRALIDFLKNDAPLADIRIDSQAVVRNSCGCTRSFANDTKSLTRPRGLASSVKASLVEHRAQLTAQLARAAKGSITGASGWEGTLLSAVSRELDLADGAIALSFEGLARTVISGGGNLTGLNDALTELRQQMVKIVALEPDYRGRLEDAFQEARYRLGDVLISAHRERAQSSALHLRHISNACFEALGQGKLDALTLAISDHLPPLGIRAAAVSRFAGEVAGQEARQLELLARVTPEFRSSESAQQRPTVLGLDSTLEHQSAVILLPMVFSGSPVGIVAFAWGAHDPLIYEKLREFMSVAAQAAS